MVRLLTTDPQKQPASRVVYGGLLYRLPTTTKKIMSIKIKLYILSGIYTVCITGGRPGVTEIPLKNPIKIFLEPLWPLRYMTK